MHQEICLHGHIDDTIEYFASAAARDAFQRCFYETSDQSLRLFSPGNELVLSPDGISHRGNGGSFCEYMFGVDQPLADLAKGDVANRLVMYGASYREDGTLAFSDRTEGRQTYERIFLEGNAVVNYFFFLTGSVSGALMEQQEGVLRLMGKLLKRSPSVGNGDDARLTGEIFDLLGHRSSFYLIKLIHKKHRRYHDVFAELYHTYKTIPDQEFEKLQALADEFGIDRYQQERIRIDIMYKHPENRRIVDEYKNILIECHGKGIISPQENARLTRLKTLSVRNKIPSALFYTLDEMLKTDKLVGQGEKDYLAETRQILTGIFLQEQQIDASINREDLIKLLEAKQQASDNRDHQFEQILLETGKACDEKIRDGGDIRQLESFSYIVTYFDRFDNTSAHINRLGFMENIRLSEEAIRSLLGNKKEFDALEPRLFDRFFFSGILQNPYLGRFGRKKMQILKEGLRLIEEGRQTVQGLLQQLDRITEEEGLYRTLLSQVKERIRHFYSRYNTKAEQEELRAEVTEELRNKDLLREDLPQDVWQDVVVNIKKEAFYLHNLLPRIVAEKDMALREDFLKNSGLDRFYLEELEREYFEINELPLDDLYQIRKGLGD